MGEKMLIRTNWDEELKYLNIGDKRLNRRVIKTVTFFFEKPSSSIPESCKECKNIKGTYRLFSNKKVTKEKLHEAHILNTLEKCSELPVVLLVQDTTEFNFTSHNKMKDIGYLTKNKTYGLFAHSTLLVTETGVPLGLINQKVWARDEKEKGKAKICAQKNIKDKESFKWLESIIETEKMFLPNQIQVSIGDRESDIYDLFTLKRKANTHFLVRSCKNRLIKHVDKKLYDAMEKSEVKGTLIVDVTRQKGGSSRKVELGFKFEKLTVKEPKNKPKEIKTVDLNVIVAEEKNPPKNTEAIKWTLLTSLPINNSDDVLKYLKWYSFRWLIERYHFVLKSGCKIEELQLDNGIKVEKALMLYSMVAIKLLEMMYLSRTNENLDCEVVMPKDEWQILYTLIKKNHNIPKQAPPLKEVVLWIAQLGGFMARKGDGNPGVKILWRGIRRFNEILEGVNLQRQIQNQIYQTYG